MAREPIGKKADPSACVTLGKIEYQLMPEMAGEQVIILLGVFDHEIYVEFKGEKLGPFYKSENPIPLGTYHSFKKTQSEEQDAEIVELAKSVKVPRSIMTINCKDKEIIEVIKNTDLVENSFDKFIPFEEINEEELFFKNTIEAKIAISKYLDKPLSILLSHQIEKIDEIISESLNKKVLLEKIKQFFTIRSCANN